MLKRQKGELSLVVLVVLGIVSVGTGLYFKYKSNKIDAPAEQLAEKTLKELFDMDVDFSDEKKAGKS
jgi:type II secretory pathway pseudopilin PulG